MRTPNTFIVIDVLEAMRTQSACRYVEALKSTARGLQSTQNHCATCVYVEDYAASQSLDPNDLSPLPRTPSRSPSITPGPPVPSPITPMLSSTSARHLTDDHDAYDETMYARQPDSLTVVTHDKFNLPALGIVINTVYHVVICIRCGHCIKLKNLTSHLQSHSRTIPVPPNIGPSLAEEFSIVSLDSVPIPRDNPPPIFGIIIEDDLYHFCDRCGRGYSSMLSLRSHQNDLLKCPRKNEEVNRSTQGYAQTFTRGQNRAFFRVDVQSLPLRSDIDPNHVQLFLDHLPPPDDPSTTLLVKPAHNQDLGTFAHRERWLDHIKGYAPEDIADMVRAAAAVDAPLQLLRRHVVQYIVDTQDLISKHASFGIPKRFAQVGE